MTDKPTPKEMDDLFVEETGFDTDDFPAAIFDFARAVLAKWGTPAPVGVEPVVACGNCGGSGRMVRDPDIGTDQECFVCDGSGSFSEPATPQPTHAQPVAREPLTNAQREKIIEAVDWYNFPQDVIDAVERAHGIKGGQHGTE